MKGINLMKTTNEIKKTTEFHGGRKKLSYQDLRVPPCTSVVKFLLLALTLLVLSCEQPFKAGLGPVVDVRPPTVSLTTPNAGDYIWSSARSFTGEADDDYILVKVELMVTNHPDIEYLRDFTEVTLTKSSQNKGTWEYIIDTTQFPDGDLKLQIRAEDSVKKEARTNEIVFLVKNQPPAISMTAPYIGQGDKDGEVSGPHLNYGSVDTLPSIVNFPRQMDKGSILSGNISDQDDIYIGEDDGTNYPPQIRLWRINDMSDPGDIEGFLPGVLPSLEQSPWQSFTSNVNLFMLGIGNYQFTWELPPDAGRFYGFEIRAQSKDGRTQFHYPRDFWPNVNPGTWEDLTTEDGRYKQENRYVLVYVRSPREYPTVDIYNLEDITGPDGWDGAKYKPLPGVNDNMAHPYVNKVTVSKNGPFTLRIRAEHSEGISSAEVYWETEDKSARGRFIWDPADEPPADNPALAPHFNVGADRPYSEWGFRDPYEFDDGYWQVRNFIFTYNHAKAIVPDDEKYHEQIRGRSKIQLYKPGDTEAWQEGKRNGTWPLAKKYSPEQDIWEDVDTLGEGVYNIEVYARSAYGTAIATPFSIAVRLDWVAPEADINTIDGAYSLDLINGEAVVNGVIRPRLRFSDSRPQDAGLRVANEKYYEHYEQRYILVKDGDNNTLDGLIAYDESREGWWPPVPEKAEDALVIGSVTAAKHGSIYDSSCIFKTSKIYDAAKAEPDALAAGVYWLYVFVRDNAFNVGRISPLRIIVDPETDKPTFDFLGSVNPDVTEADPEFDYVTSQSFWYNGELRNKFGPNSAVRLRLTDDDSLALGFAGGDASSIKVGFVGSYTDVDGKIKAYDDDAHQMALTDAQIKERFNPLPGSNATDFRAVRDRQGEISQTTLLNLLRSNAEYDYLFTAGDKNSYTNLPDGLYRISISVEDYSPAKLVVKSGDDPAIPAVRSAQFWIAVDTANPVIDSPEGYPGGYIDAAGVTFNGTLSDRNGPVKEIDFTIDVRNSLGQTVQGITAAPGPITWTPPTFPGGLWSAQFTAPVINMTNQSGIYTFTLRFKDRFENVSSIERRYQLDATDPVVAMRTPIKTFNRSNANDFPGVSGDVSTHDGIDNRARLVNGVTSFMMSATDNFRVVEARWWLLPAGTEPTGWNSYINVDVDGAFASYDTTALTTAKGKANRLTANFTSQTFFVDTKDLDDVTEYIVWAMARDEAGRYSDGGAATKIQTIFVLQEEDKPHFGRDGDPTAADLNLRPNITPSMDMVVGESGLKLRGTIYDDDGFVDSAGDPLLDSVQVWVSANPAAGSIDLDAGFTTSLTTLSYAGPVSIPADRLRRTGVTNAGLLEFDLLAQSAFSNGSNGILDTDGIKHYVIQATDSYYGKFEDETGAAADTTHRVSRRKHFSFVLDKIDPVITITHPNLAILPQGQILTFGPGSTSGATQNVSFYLIGSIKDTYLKKTADGNYYINFRLGTGELEEIKLGIDVNNPAGSSYITSITTVDTLNDTVNFSIPADEFTTRIKFNTLPVNNTLTLFVDDQSGKTGSASLSFVKDTDKPEASFVNIAKVELPQIDGGNWWTKNTNPADYLLKRAEDLPVIKYSSGNIPSITGTFSDAVSNIDTGTVKFWFDNVSTELAGPFTITGTGKNVSWTVYLTTDGSPSGTILTDGVHSISFEVADTVGNVLTSGVYGFRINSEKPTVTLTAPANNGVFGGANGSGVIFNAAGTASSVSRLENVALEIRYTEDDTGVTVTKSIDLDTGWTFVSAGASNTLPGQLLTETLTWNVNITLADLLVVCKLESTDVFSSLKQGIYEISLTATDAGGLESDEVAREFTIDHSSPAITFDDLTTDTDDNRLSNYWVDWVDDNPAVPPANILGERNILRGSKPMIRGNIKDDWSNLKDVEIQIRRFDYGNNIWENYFDFATPGWTIADGTNADSWKALMTTSSPSPEYSLNFDLLQQLGGALPDGLYNIRVRARDSSTINGNTNAADWFAGDGNPVYSPYVYFFRENANPTIVHVNDTTTAFSSRNRPGNIIPFTVTATDANRFDKLVVTVQTLAGAAIPALTQPINGPRSGSNTWTPTVNIAFTPETYADGSYVIFFKVTDLADGEYEIRRTITLDNTVPTANIENPMLIGPVRQADANGNPTTTGDILYNDASETMLGGEDVKISGTSGDTGSAGVTGIWYHLGYGSIDETKPFPHWTDFVDEVAGVQFIGTGDTRIDQDGNNALFDAAARANNNAWFKYEYDADTNYPVPPGFKPFDTKLDLYSWELSILAANNNGLAYYAGDNITVKGDTYNASTGPRMTYPVDEDKIPSYLRKGGGLYSLPLWIRVSDGVGNINYYQRDIWIYPNGDNPTTAIINPSAPFTDETQPMGGMIGIDGMASDNLGVKTVIYRVKVDNRRKANENDTTWYTVPPNDDDGTANADASNIIEFYNKTRWVSGYANYTAMKGIWDKYITPTGSGGLGGSIAESQDGWYVVPDTGVAPDLPWDFILNDKDADGEAEIAKLIPTKGFRADGSANSNDTIRVWLEVFVFDDRDGAYNLMSLGNNNNNALNPKPFTRVFYLKDTSPEITNKQISAKNAFIDPATAPAAGAYGGTDSYLTDDRIRSGRFAVKAHLSGSGIPISQISVKLPGELNSNWQTVYDTVSNKNLSGITLKTKVGEDIVDVVDAVPTEEIYFTYAFDTKVTTATNGFAPWLGLVENSSTPAAVLATYGGVVTVDLRIRDTSGGQSLYTFKVTVDNFAPIPDRKKNFTNKKVAGSNQVFVGRTFDYQNTERVPQPTYGKVQTVYAWFTKRSGDKKYIDLNNDNVWEYTYTHKTPSEMEAEGLLTSMPAWIDRDADFGASWDGDAPPTITGLDEGEPDNTIYYPMPGSKYVKVMSEATSSNMRNRITWQTVNINGRDVLWNFISDTTEWPDGWLDMHCLVVDNAGNASYYTQSMVVMNNYPQITDIRLQTNNTGEGAVFTTHPTDNAFNDYKVSTFSSGYLNSGFIAKNNTISFSVETAKGNYPLYYRLQAVKRYEIPLTVDNLGVMAAKSGDLDTVDGGTMTITQSKDTLYTIANLGNFGRARWNTLGVRVDEPVAGTHFVFQATSDEITYVIAPTLTEATTSTVYAYKTLFTKDNDANTSDNSFRLGTWPDTTLVTNLAQVPDATTAGYDITGAVLNFSNADGTEYFGDAETKIKHGLGSKPKELYPDWTGDEANTAEMAFFLIKVYDTVDENDDRGETGFTEDNMLYDAVVVGMNVYLHDTTPPVARLYDLNPYTENADSDEAATPNGIGANIKRGGLYNLGTARAPIKSGYIDPRDSSTALYPHVNYPKDPVDPYLGSRQERPTGYSASSGDTISTGTTNRDKVSGSILLRGLAWDDQLIDEIRINIGGTSKPILRLTTASNGSREMKPVGAEKAWAYEEINWKNGHTVEWAYLWNTEAEPTHGGTGGRPLENQTVAVIVRDAKGVNPTPPNPAVDDDDTRLLNNRITVTGAGATPATPTALPTENTTTSPMTFHNTVQVDIVPYITGFKRDPKYVNTRSRQGWYSFYQGETGIAIQGYNLGSSGSVRLSVLDAGTGADIGGRNSITIPTNASSGRLDYWTTADASAGQAYNHKSIHATRSWNREYNAFTPGSNLWNNKPHAHIWRTNEQGGTNIATYFGNASSVYQGSHGAENPSMALEYNTATNAYANVGRLTGVWSVYANADTFFARNNGLIRMDGNDVTGGNGRGFHSNGGSATTPAIPPGEPFIKPDVSFYGGNTSTNALVITYEGDGGNRTRLRMISNFSSSTNANINIDVDTATGTPGDAVTNVITDELISTKRWQNARALKSTNATNNTTSHAVAYDASYQALYYTRAGNTSTTNNRYSIDGTSGLNLATVSANNVSGTITNSANAGMYSAIDYDSTGIVVAYYDVEHDTLRLAYASSLTPTNANWTRRYIFSEGHPLRRGSGTHVSMKIDTNSNIHLAFFNSANNTVVYAVGTRTQSSDFTAYTVDNVVTGGQWTDISLRQDSNNVITPWIVYANSSRTGSYDGVRIAYKDSMFTRPLTDPVTGADITGWEALTMPAAYTVNDDRLNIEAWPPVARGNTVSNSGTRSQQGAQHGNGTYPSAWDAAVGYGSDMFRIGYFYKPNGTATTGLVGASGGTNNIVNWQTVPAP